MQARGIILDAPVEESTSAIASDEPLFETTPSAADPIVADAIARWTVRAAAFLFPLAFLPNTVSEFVLPKLLLLRLVLAVLGILLVFRWFSQRAITWRPSPVDLPLAAFVVSAALSTVFAINRNLAIFGSYDRWEGLLTIASYALLFWLTVQMLSGQADARALTWSLLASGYCVGAVAILQSGFGLLGGGNFEDKGLIRADVTLAHPDFTGIFLAMLLPIAVGQALSMRPVITRVVSACIAIVIGLGLLVTFTRAAWFGAIVGIAIALSFRGHHFRVWPVAIAVAILLGALIVSRTIASQPSASGLDVVHYAATRIASTTDFGSGSVASRLNTWRDIPSLIAGRPILGWGPDTFGLVYPQYQSRYRGGEFFDKPHQELLGIAAAEGVVGLAAYTWMLIAFVRTFWRGRQARGAVALFAGLLGYWVSIQYDFSWIPAAIPFWLLAACAIVTWTPELRPVRLATFERRLAGPVLAIAGVALAALMIPAVVAPYLADANYYAAQAKPNLEQARATIGQARQLAPLEATYAIGAGNYALNLDEHGVPARNAEWQAAREAYETAARLGSFSPEMFQTLALVDEHLGDHAAALVAARQALALDRFDPTSQKLLKELSAHLALTSSFVGTVHNRSGAAVVNASVQAYQAASGATCCKFVAGGPSDARGNYSFTLPAGTYKIWINPPAGYPQQWYGGSDFASATLVIVNGSTTVNITLTSSVLSGTVHNGSGVANASVQAYQAAS